MRDYSMYHARPHLLSMKELEWAYEKWCFGYTYEEIAKALYCSPKTLLREFKHHGWKKVRPPLHYYE